LNYLNARAWSVQTGSNPSIFLGKRKKFCPLAFPEQNHRKNLYVPHFQAWSKVAKPSLISNQLSDLSRAWVMAMPLLLHNRSHLVVKPLMEYPPLARGRPRRAGVR